MKINGTSKKRSLTLLRLVALSPVLMALAWLLVADLAFRVTKAAEGADPVQMPSQHTWVYWAAQDLLHQKTNPDVVLLGTSLFMFPLAKTDANFLNRPLDYLDNHRSAYMEHAMMKEFGSKESHCFNFGLPGGMMSDNYMVLRCLLKERRKPKVLVLGLAPRDFMDCQVHYSGATLAFRYLKRFTDICDLVDLAYPKPQQRLDYWLDKLCYLKGHQLELKVATEDSIKPLQAMRVRYQAPCRTTGTAVAEGFVFDNTVERGCWISKPFEPDKYIENSSKYKKHYQSANPELFEVQRRFLTMFLDLAQQEGIPAVIVNMPLTRNNTVLMPEGTQERYKAMLKEAARQYGLPYLNLHRSRTFLPSDFSDPVHLNASGGKKVVDAIVKALHGNAEIAASMHNSAAVASRNDKQL